MPIAMSSLEVVACPPPHSLISVAREVAHVGDIARGAAVLADAIYMHDFRDARIWMILLHCCNRIRSRLPQLIRVCT